MQVVSDALHIERTQPAPGSAPTTKMLRRKPTDIAQIEMFQLHLQHGFSRLGNQQFRYRRHLAGVIVSKPSGKKSRWQFDPLLRTTDGQHLCAALHLRRSALQVHREFRIQRNVGSRQQQIIQPQSQSTAANAIQIAPTCIAC